MWWLDVEPAAGAPDSSGGNPRANLLEAGDPAPGFSLPAHDGGQVDSAELYGSRPVVLFYYPKANTGG
jgi:hypothetical protein